MYRHTFLPCVICNCNRKIVPTFASERKPQICTWPIHWPTQGQWWSNRSTQLLQMEQWEHRGGRYNIHVSQYLTLTCIPLTVTSLVRGNCRPGVCEELSYENSSSGGCEFRGTTPGSRAEVRTRRISTWEIMHRF